MTETEFTNQFLSRVSHSPFAYLLVTSEIDPDDWEMAVINRLVSYNMVDPRKGITRSGKVLLAHLQHSPQIREAA